MLDKSNKLLLFIILWTVKFQKEGSWRPKNERKTENHSDKKHQIEERGLPGCLAGSVAEHVILDLWLSVQAPCWMQIIQNKTKQN